VRRGVGCESSAGAGDVKVCLLVIIGVRADATKELIALADAFRESSQSWADLLRDCKRRGMRAPVLAVGDGALGFWKALREVFPTTGEQRCWFHVSGNILAALPKSAHPGAKAVLAEIYNAEDRDHARKAVKAFEADYGAKWPKAVAKITEHLDVLLAFYDFPTEHWVHLRTTNPIWVDLRHRPPAPAGHKGTRLTGSRRRDGVQAHRVGTNPLARQQRAHLVALVRAGARFERGKLVERPNESEVNSKSRDTPIRRS